MIRVFVVDDHTLFREGLRALIAAQPDMAWAGDAADGEAALEALRGAEVDVVLMDVNMPGRSGVEVTRALTDDAPDLAVIMVSMVEDEASMFASLEAGARGYVLKGSDVDEMLEVVRAVAAGRLMFGDRVAERMLDRLRTPPGEPRRDGVFAELTARELEILELIARGRGNAEIGAALFISPRTVRNHITNIFSKLRVRDRAAAIVKAREAGFGR